MRNECLLSQSESFAFSWDHRSNWSHLTFLLLVCELSVASVRVHMLHLCRGKNHLKTSPYTLFLMTEMQREGQMHTFYKTHSLITPKKWSLLLIGCDILQHFPSGWQLLIPVVFSCDVWWRLWGVNAQFVWLTGMLFVCWSLWMLAAWCCWAVIMKMKPVERLKVYQVHFSFPTMVGFLWISCWTWVQHVEWGTEPGPPLKLLSVDSKCYESEAE